jgi:F0F1-type ATP synthase membrane subunit c/vacuolar-type H+-ATPase subunit K
MTIAQQMRGAVVIHVALLGTLVIYAVIGVEVSHQAPPKGMVDPALFGGVLGAVSLVMLAIIPMLRKKAIPPRVLEGGPLDLDRTPEPHELTALNKLRGGSILTWALCEAIAIYGLILTLLYREPLYYVPFAVVGAGAMLAYRPTRALFESVIRGARAPKE